jgi:hypothetical protein
MMERRRYRKISTRVWGDEKFRTLSRPQPNGQSLWFYLLTGPHTTALPGLFVAGEAGLSEALGWPLLGFRKAFAELTRASMALADWDARVVWLPKAVHHNAPESPNVVKGWKSALDEIPECRMKHVAAQALKDFLLAYHHAFAHALGEGWPEPLTEGSAHPSLYQEQEQKQEPQQEQEPKAPLRSAGAGFEAFWSGYPKKKSRSDAEKAWRKLAPSPELTQRIMDAIAAQRNSLDWLKEAGKYIPYPASWLNAKRWEDELEVRIEALTVKPAEDWFDECVRIHDGACGLDRWRHHLRKEREAARDGVHSTNARSA